MSDENMTDQWGRPLTGAECKALALPGDMPVYALEGTQPARYTPFGLDYAAYQLPADHAAYIVADWNRDHGDQPPFRYWVGGEEAPGDWDGGPILLDWGDEIEEYQEDTELSGALAWRRDPDGAGASWADIIGFRTSIPAESANCPGVIERLCSLRQEMELRFTGQFVENTLNTIDAAIASLAPHHPEGSDVADLLERLKARQDDTCDEAASLIERMEGENFRLAAGQCIVDGGLIGDERGNLICTARQQALRDAAKALIDVRSSNADFKREGKEWEAYDQAVRDCHDAIDKLQTRGGSE